MNAEPKSDGSLTEDRSVLDASALFQALLGEPGSGVVQARIERVVVPARSLSAVAAKLGDRGFGKGNLEDILASLDLPVGAFDQAQAVLAVGRGYLMRRVGLLLGDRACLALAISEGVPAVTTDRNWSGVALALRIEVVLAR